MSDRGHYYDNDGNLILEVPNASKPGEMRSTTLADARKLGLNVSVTTILGLLAKPFLNDWSLRQGIKAARLQPDLDEDSLVVLSQERRDSAAHYGTEIHDAVNRLLTSQPLPDYDNVLAPDHGEAVAEFVTKNFKVLESEMRLVNTDERLAGTVDLLTLDAIVDFKTQDWEEGKRPNLHKDHDYQMAGYCKLLGEGAPRVFSKLYINRSRVGDMHLATIKGEEAEHAIRCWESIHQTWKLVNKFP